MRFTIEKPKTHKGLSYALKSSILKTAVEEIGININVNLVFWTPKNYDSILSAEYWLPNENIEYERFYIRTGVVPSAERKKVQQLMEEIIIPELIKKIVSIKEEPENSTNIKHGSFFDASYHDGILKINKNEIKYDV